MPGSPEFCAVESDLIDWLMQIGNDLIAWAKGQTSQLDIGKIVASISDTMPDVVGMDTAKQQVAYIVASMLAQVPDALQMVREAISCALNWANALLPPCNFPVVVVLVGVRSIIGMPKPISIDLGQDLSIYAKGELGIFFETVADVKLLGGVDGRTGIGWKGGSDIKIELPEVKAWLDRLIRYFCPIELPSPAEATKAWQRGQIDVNLRDCVWRLNGLNPGTYIQYALADSDRLTAHEIILYGRRLGMSADEIDKHLKSIGWNIEWDRTATQKLYDELPNIADHLHWLQRNVFDDTYVKKYKLDDGFEERFWTKFGPALYAQGYTKERAYLQYAAHWIMPSPEQMRQFVYRLRPGRVPDDVAFTLDDYKRVLAEQDYNVLAREWFAATVHPVPAISYIKVMFQLGVIDADKLKAYHQDLGYKDEDADNFVAVDKVQRVRHLATSGHGFTPAAMAGAYSVRQMGEDEVRKRMDEQGYPQDIATDLLRRADYDLQRTILVRARSRVLQSIVSQVKQAVSVGTLDVIGATQVLAQAGWPPEYAAGLASLANASANTQLVQGAVRKLRSAYLAGEITDGYAGSALETLGINSGKARQYLLIWQMENTPNRKRRTAAQITSDLADGRISTADALSRLLNLGYNDADQQLYLADARAKIVKSEATAAAKEVKAVRQHTADLARTIRQADSQRRRLVNDLRRMEPVGKLQSWLRKGIVTEQYFRARLALYGYNQAEVAAYEAEAHTGSAGTSSTATSQPGGTG